MHRYFFATKDAFISSGSNQITGEDWINKNTGQDEILELKKVFWNRDFHYPTRALIQFDVDEIETYISSSVLPSTYKLNLRLWETEGTSGLSEDYTIAAYPLSESWDEGVGKEGDTPKTTDGVSWKNRKYPTGGSEINWSSTEGSTYASSSMTVYHVPSGSDVGDPDELKIGDVEFTFISSSTGYTNTATQIFVTHGNNHGEVVENLRDAINNNTATHNLNISASKLGAGLLTTAIIISGSISGTSANLTVTTGSGGDKIATTPSWMIPASIAGGTDTSIAGFGGYYISSDEVTQSFSSESPDLNMDITSLADKWFGGVNSNYGMLLRFSGSRETSTGSFEDLKFFSRQTNTIYAPKLELKWDDHLPATGSNTGSLTALDVGGTAENYLYPIHFREAYKENETVKFRFGARKRYIQKSFTTSVQTVSGSFIPWPSGSYSIIDMATNEDVVPFSAYTTMSCDTTSNYFKQDLNAFEPNRAYKILVKVKHNDGQEIIYDNDFEFILRV